MQDWKGSNQDVWQRPGLNGAMVGPGASDYDAGYGPGGFTLRQPIQTIWRFRYLVLLAVAIALAIGYYQSKVRVQQYRSTALIHISSDQASPLAGLSGGVARMLGGAPGGGLRSDVELMRSMSVMTDVVDQAGLRLVEIKEGLLSDQVHPAAVIQEPEVLREPDVDRFQLSFGADEVVVRAGTEERRVAYGQRVEIAGVRFVVRSRPEVAEAEVLVMPRFAAAELLARSLDIRIRTDTNVLDIIYDAYAPDISERVVNATVKSFQDFENRRKQEVAGVRRTFLREQITYTDSLLTEVQQDLIDFQQRVEGRSARERFTSQQSGLLNMELRQSEIESQRAMYDSMLDDLASGSLAREERINTLVSAPMITDNPVLEALVERLMGYEDQRDRLTAGAFGSAQSNPEVARLDSLISATENRLTDAVVSLVAGLDARIDALDQLHERTVAGMRSLPAADAEELRLEYQIEATADILQFLQEEYHMARVEEAVASGRVEIVDLARPGDPFGSDPVRTLTFALIFGLMFGSGGALLLGNIGSSIKGRDEVEQVLHLNQLAVIPSLDDTAVGTRWLRRLQNGNGNGRLPVAAADHVTAHDHSYGIEAYRALRTNLTFGRGLDNLGTIAITSSAPMEGRTTTVANLGATLAQQGKRVLLIDCDLRRPQLHHIFGVSGDRGLSEVITGQLPASGAVQAASVTGLFVLPAGPLIPDALHLLGTSRMSAVMDELSSAFDVILLDTPPLQITLDGAAIAARADAAVFLVRAGKTDRRMAQHSLQQLAALGANVVGGVLNDADERSPFRDPYGHGAESRS